MTSYLIENEAETYKMEMSILPKFLTLKWNISRTIWYIEVGDGSFFCVFHALAFELNFFFDQRFPLQFIKGKGFLAQDVRVAAQTGNLEKWPREREADGKIAEAVER